MESLPIVIVGTIMNHLCFPKSSPTYDALFEEQLRTRVRAGYDEEDHWYQQDALNLAATCKSLRAKLMPLLWETVTVIVMQDIDTAAAASGNRSLPEFRRTAREKAIMPPNSLFVLNCMWEENRPLDQFILGPVSSTSTSSKPVKSTRKRDSLKSFLRPKKYQDQPIASPSPSPSSPSTVPSSTFESSISYIKTLRLYFYNPKASLGPNSSPAIEKAIYLWSLVDPKSMPRLTALELELAMGPRFTKPTTELQEALQRYPIAPEVEVVMSPEMANMFGA